jgi:hypothetical protein
VDTGLEKSVKIIEVYISKTKYGFSFIFFDCSFNDKTDPKAVEILENRINCDYMVTCLLWTVKYSNISSICTSGFMEYLYYCFESSNKVMGYQACGLKEMPVLFTDLPYSAAERRPFSGPRE